MRNVPERSAVLRRLGASAARRYATAGMLAGLAFLLASCGDDGAGPSPILRVEVVGGDSISAPVGSRIPVNIRVTDGLGSAARRAAVTWTAAHGSGRVTSARDTTDVQGHAAAEWVLATTATLQTLSIRIDNRTTAIVSATAVPGSPAWLRLPADTLRLTGLRETVALAPQVTDTYGNEVRGLPLRWEVHNPVIAAVDSAGRVTALARGRTHVIVRAGALADTLRIEVDPRGAITLTFDDGWKGVHTRALPILREQGLRANVAVITESVGWPGYLDLEQLRSLHDAGWSVVSHTVSHANLTELTDAQLERELRDSKTWIEARGFRGASVFIVPFHAAGERERAAIRQHYRAARGYTAGQFRPDSLVQWMPSDPFVLTGVEAEFAPFTTHEGREKLRAYLERATSRGEFVDIFFHDVRPEDLDGFRELVTILAQFKDRIRPYHELFGESGA